MDYKSLLNENQYKAVSTTAKYARVVAGAGSGKTRVLTYRISYLISEFGVDPSSIVAIAFTNGMIFAIIMGFVAYFWFGIKLLGVVIAMSMVINFTFAGIFGTVIPLTLKKFGIDPAVGSSVLLTTVTDIVGFFSFLGLATWILL